MTQSYEEIKEEAAEFSRSKAKFGKSGANFNEMTDWWLNIIAQRDADKGEHNPFDLGTQAVKGFETVNANTADKGEKKCAGCGDCLNSKATTGEECVKMRDCKCHSPTTNEKDLAIKTLDPSRCFWCCEKEQPGWGKMRHPHKLDCPMVKKVAPSPKPQANVGEDMIDELYSLAWQDGNEGLNRRHELNVRFLKELNNLISTTSAQKLESVEREIEKYVAQENAWDENSKDKFQKGALQARNKMKDKVLDIIRKQK